MESEIVISFYAVVVFTTLFAWFFAFIYAPKTYTLINDDYSDSAKENLHISGATSGTTTSGDYSESGNIKKYLTAIYNIKSIEMFAKAILFFTYFFNSCHKHRPYY